MAIARPTWLFVALALPGLGDAPARRPVSVHEPPWSALVRVQVAANARCTGVLIAADRVVTAAHCLWAGRVGRMVRAGSVHVLTGYDHGAYTAHAVATDYRVGAGFEPRGQVGLGADFAVLTLANPIGTVTLPWAAAVRPGQPAMLGGWEQDRAEALLADTTCHVTGRARDAGSRPLLAHDCAGTHGVSGGPLLVRGDDGAWSIAGIDVAARATGVGGLAVPAATVRALLDRRAVR